MSRVVTGNVGKDTKELLDALEKCEEFGKYYSEHQEDLLKKTLAEELETLLEKKGLKKTAVTRDAQISDIYGYQIFSGARRPERPKLLRLLVAMGASLSETQEFLKHAGFAQLYAKNPADCVIIYGICHKMNVGEINDLLFDYELPLI